MKKIPPANVYTSYYWTNKYVMKIKLPNIDLQTQGFGFPKHF